MDTIYALASALGKAGVAVIRVSGPAAFDAVKSLAGRLPEPRHATLMTLRTGDGGLLDRGLVLVFDAGGSFTGEQVAEFQIHGSKATISATLAALDGLSGVRLALPGEFTRRALENGVLDLTEVEGLADLIEAETEAQRKQAIQTLSGALGERTAEWRKDLVRALALLAATIDFADEEVPEDVGPEVNLLIDRVSSSLENEAEGVHTAERLRDGFEVAILGPPNVGKSTLLNRLAGREAALTSEIAGTTRDVIEVRMDLHGIPVTFLDTAGLRDTDDVVESMGIARALARAADSDLRIFLKDSDGQSGHAPSPEDLVYSGKSDLSAESNGVSGLTGQGVDALLEEIRQRLSDRVARIGVAVHERHRRMMLDAHGLLQETQEILISGPENAEIAAETLRAAVHSLDALVGKVDVETVLDDVFQNFCLGK